MVLQETPYKYCNQGYLNRCTTANSKSMRVSIKAQVTQSIETGRKEGRKEGDFRRTNALESALSHPNSHVDETIY